MGLTSAFSIAAAAAVHATRTFEIAHNDCVRMMPPQIQRGWLMVGRHAYIMLAIKL